MAEKFVPNFKVKYTETVAPELLKEFAYKSVMQIPAVEKIVLSVGVGEATTNKKLLDAAVKELEQISGQHVVRTKARKSIANFKVREGQEIGAMVTLRGDNMWYFLERLICIALPRVKVWTDARRSMLRTRWREDRARQNLDWWRWYFKLVAASDFLCGRCPPDKNGRTFTADLEWLIKPTNMPKVLEGKYSNRKHADVFEQAKRLGYDEIKRQSFGSFGSLRDEIIDIDGEVQET